MYIERTNTKCMLEMSGLSLCLLLIVTRFVFQRGHGGHVDGFVWIVCLIYWYYTAGFATTSEKDLCSC